MENAVNVAGRGGTPPLKGFSSGDHISSPSLQAKGRLDINCSRTNFMFQKLTVLASNSVCLLLQGNQAEFIEETMDVPK